jgi:hypothetical protein
MPLRALAGLGAEIEGRTVDLLVLTRLTAWRIVTGKWISLVVQSALLTASLLPYGVVRFYLGPVDLATDLGIIALMLTGSALLTAVALWASGWSRGVRVLVGVGLVLMIFVGPNVGMSVRYYSGGSRYGGPAPGPFWLLGAFFNPSWGWSWLSLLGVALFDGALLGLFSLVQAARRLAPAAENHALATRALALLALLPAPLLAATHGEAAALSHLWLSVLVLLAVGGMEVAQVAVALGVHARPWWRRGSWHTLVGRFALPGWPSAALFCAVAMVCLFAATVLCDLLTNGLPFDLRFGAWWLALGWVALVFPALMMSLGSRERQARFGVGVYWITQGLLGIVSLIALANTAGDGWGPSTKIYIVVLDAFSQVVPVSSFWLGWRWVPANANFTSLAFSPAVMLGQAAVLLATVWLYRRRSRDYWADVWARQSRPAEDGTENAPAAPPLPPPEPSAP